VGDALVKQGNLSAALQTFRDSLGIRQHLTEVEPSNAQWQKDLHYSIDAIGGLAFRFVLTREFAAALDAADQATSLAPDKLWLRAHALMFLGA